MTKTPLSNRLFLHQLKNFKMIFEALRDVEIRLRNIEREKKSVKSFSKKEVKVFSQNHDDVETKRYCGTNIL